MQIAQLSPAWARSSSGTGVVSWSSSSSASGSVKVLSRCLEEEGMQSGSESVDTTGRVVTVAGDFSFIISVAAGLISVDVLYSACRTGDDRDDGRGSGVDPDGDSGGELRSMAVATSPDAIPPAADSPARSRCARHDLYVIVGKRSLTSSIFKSFFSRRLRWTGWCSPTKGWRVAKSTSSSNWAPRRFR
jgi:hypothetical protein